MVSCASWRGSVCIGIGCLAIPLKSTFSSTLLFCLPPCLELAGSNKKHMKLLLLAFSVICTVATNTYSQNNNRIPESTEQINKLIKTFLDSELKSKVPNLTSYSIDSIETISLSEKQKVQHDALLIVRQLQKLKKQKEELEIQYEVEPTSDLSYKLNKLTEQGKAKIQEVNELLELANTVDSVETFCYTVTVHTSVILNNGVKRTSDLFFRISKDYFIIMKPEEFMTEIYVLFNH